MIFPKMQMFVQSQLTSQSR